MRKFACPSLYACAVETHIHFTFVFKNEPKHVQKYKLFDACVRLLCLDNYSRKCTKYETGL